MLNTSRFFMLPYPCTLVPLSPPCLSGGSLLIFLDLAQHQLSFLNSNQTIVRLLLQSFIKYIPHTHTLPRPEATSPPHLLPIRQNFLKGDILQRQTRAVLGGSALSVTKDCKGQTETMQEKHQEKKEKKAEKTKTPWFASLKPIPALT